MLIAFTATHSLAQQQPAYEEYSLDFSTSDVQEEFEVQARQTDGITLRFEDGTTTSHSGSVEVPLEDVAPILGVGNIWIADRNAPDGIELEIRGSVDGEEWTDWFDAGFDPHFPVEDGRHSGQLVFFDPNTKVIEYRLTASDEWNEELVVKNLDFAFINPTATPEEDMEQMRATARHNLEIQGESLLEPEYIDRETWGEPLDLSNTNSDRDPMDVTHLVVHHSASEHDVDDWAAVVRTIHGWHVDGNDWADIGYQWLVGEDGSMFQGRAFHSEEEENVTGDHIGGQNTNALGFCVIGNFDVDDNFPTEDALDGLYHLLAWRADLADIDVLDSSTKVEMDEETEHIGGHRDYNPTQCPGDNLYDELDMVREETAEFMDTIEEYHIPQDDHELGFESLADAFEFFNTTEPEAASIVNIHEDLEEDASELTLEADELQELTNIIFRPAGESDVTIHLTGSNESGIVLDETQYITFDGTQDDGSITLTGDGDLNNLMHITNESDHITIEGISFRADDSENDLTGISISDISDSEQIAITGNTFGEHDKGLAAGLSIANTISGVQLDENEFFYKDNGISVYNSESLNISGQKFTGAAGSDQADRAGAIRLTESTDISAYENEIAIEATEAHQAGIEFNSTTDSRVYNNIIRFTGNEETAEPGSLFGLSIHDTEDELSSSRFVYNTVHVEESEAFGSTAAFSISDETSADIGGQLLAYNNLFINRSQAEGAKAFIMPEVDFSFDPGEITPIEGLSRNFDYNNYFASGDEAYLGRYGEEVIEDLNHWREISDQDEASSSTDVNFVSETDLRLVDPSVGDVQFAGIPDPNIDTDFFGNERNWTKPYMGAHEGEVPLTIVDATDYYVGVEGSGPDGSNPNFQTLSEAFFILSDLDISRPKTLYITSDIYDTTETAILENDLFSEENDLVIKPAYDEKFELTLADGIHIRNTSNVIFSGKTEDSGEAAGLQLTLTEEESGAALFVTEDAQNVTIRHLTITHDTGNQLYGGGGVQIRRDDAATVAPDNIVIENNQIGTEEAHFSDGVRVWGTSGLPVTNTLISGNEIHAGQRGITTFVNDEDTYEDNTIIISGLTDSPGFYAGIYYAAVENSLTQRNEILMAGSNSANPTYLAGININLNVGELNFYNNTISYAEDYDARQSTYNSPYGIAIHREGGGEAYNFYHNSINIEDINENMVVSPIGWENDITTSSAEFSFINNIFRNISTSDMAALVEWDVELEALTNDYNLWYTEEADFAVLDGEELEDLSEWQNETGEGDASRVDEVFFKSDNNLRLGEESDGQTTLSGTPLAEVTEDIDGNPRSDVYPYKGAYEHDIELITKSDEEPVAEQPGEYELKDNYPNPFNPATTIEYRLPETSQVELTVYTIEGRRVETLVNEQQEAGIHNVTFDASGLASGTYIYRIQTENFTDTEKMMFVK